MKRLLSIAFLLALLATPAAALAQGLQQPVPQQTPQPQRGGPFGPLPAPRPEATPTPTAPPSIAAQQETDRSLLYLVGAALVVIFVVIGFVIVRDARNTLHERGEDAGPQLARDQGPHKHPKGAKAKARAKTKAQRRARRANR